MDYLSKFLAIQAQPKPVQDPVTEFHKSWTIIKDTLQQPDERQLTRGIASTDVPSRLRSLGDALVHESSLPEYTGGTGPCMEYLLKNDVLGTLVQLSEPDRPSGILAEVLRTVSNMVVLLDEQFLVHSAVHKAIIRLLRACTGDEFQDRIDGRNKAMGAAADHIRAAPSDYELDLVDLLCVLCSRIRTYRQLLLIFFHDKNWLRVDTTQSESEDEDEEDEQEDPVSPVDSMSTITSAPSARKPEYEFLLFNYLLRYVHREGRIGDFARAGILFLVDVAMGAPSGDLRRLQDDFEEKLATPGGPDPIADAALALAEYILDGDFAEVLGAGLVAVYSLLPSKLEVRRDALATSAEGSMTLGMDASDILKNESQRDAELERARTFGLELSSDPEFRSRLDHFLKMIEFLQDVLRRNSAPAQEGEGALSPSAVVGQAISTGILQAVKAIFLENVLYPSVLESSNVDGSAVAVLSYIDMTLRSLPDGPLSELFIDFLMSEDDVEVKRPTLAPRRSTKSQKEAKLRRRKSTAMMLLELETPVADRRQSTYFASLGRFTLKDLVFSNLRTMSDRAHDAASTAVLQLLQTLLALHPRLTVDKLLIPNGLPELPLLQEAESATLGSPTSDEDFVYPTGEESPEEAEVRMPIFRLPDTTFNTHERELGLYLNLVARIDPAYDADVFSTGYDNYLSDALDSIRAQQDRVAPNLDVHELVKYRLNPNDTLLSLLLQSMRTFFAHSVEYNVALTGALSAIAGCPTRSLVGWMTFSTEGELAQILGAEDEEDDDGADDRSLDDRIATLAADMSQASNASLSSHPILYIILRGLALQVDRYRSTLDNFDSFLGERRQGLRFAENLTDALSLSIELDQDSSFFASLKNTLSPTSSKPMLASSGTSTPPRSKPSGLASLVPSFLTPKKDRVSLLGGGGTPASSTSFDAQPSTPRRDKNSVQVAASPFGPHYEKTGKISVQPLVAHVDDEEGIAAGWTPPRFNEPDSIEEDSEEEDGEDVFAPKWERPSKNREPPVIKTKVTLSQLLDNVVILEEFMKELSAIVQIRRSLGIDAVRYF